MNENADKRLDKLIEDFDTAMLVTNSLEGQLRARPMAIAGHIETDPAVAKMMWRSSMKIWFPEGVNDSQLTLILVEPEQAEYWDRTGLRKLNFLWQAGKALLSGNKPDDQRLSGHAKVRPN